MYRQWPDSFRLPSAEARANLEPGDLAKLIFRISVDNDDELVSVERIWVIVRERVGAGHLGILDNDPDAIRENQEFWSGIERRFSPRHVIDIQAGDESTAASAVLELKRRWSSE